MTANLDAKASAELGETVEIALLGRLGRPRLEVVAFDRGGECGRRSEEPARLARGKSGEPRRLEIGGAAIGGLDQGGELGRQDHGQAEAQVNGGKEARLDYLVDVAD